jgi:capsular polysaccharide biosynthesis protein
VFPKLYVPSWPNGDKAAPMAGLFGVYKDLPIRPAPGGPRKLYLTRERLRLRPMLNEREVRELFIRRGFEVVDPGELSHDEAREVFSAAACLAGPYGSAFHNLVFCGRPVRNLVLMPPHRPHHLTETMVWHAEHDQTFSYIQGEPVTEALDDTRWTAPLDRVEKALNAVLHALGEAEA